MSSQPASPRQMLEQKRAGHAWEAVSRFAGTVQDEARRKAFVREAKRLPMRAHAAGLGHALLFVKVKQQGKPGEQVLEAVCDWLAREQGVLGRPTAGRSAVDHCFASIREGSSVLYRRTTDEALAYLQWLARFAEAEFGADDGVDDE